MNNYLTQFKNLPKELQEAVSSEEKVRVLEEIEAKYNLKLAKLVVRVMIKDITWPDLEKFCQENFKLTLAQASELKKDLTEKIFNEVLGYLGKPIYEITKPYKSTKVEERRQIETDRDMSPAATKQVEIDRNIPLMAEKSVEIKIKEPMPVVAPINLTEMIKNIKEKAGLTFEDKILERRLENMINSYLKEVRDEIQLEEALSRPKKIGGLELPREKITEIIKILKDTHRNIQPEAVKLIETNRDVQQEVAKLMETKPVFLEEKPTKETIKPVSKELEKPSFVKMPAGEPVETKRLEKSEIPVQIRRPISSEKRVEDISLTPRALGPVEELLEITLTDLQRWGGGQKTSQIILDKINLLQEESLSKKAKGIRAWQQSPLFKLYLEIGKEALEKKKPLVEIIGERKIQNIPYLEMADWEALAELNRKLRF